VLHRKDVFEGLPHESFDYKQIQGKQSSTTQSGSDASTISDLSDLIGASAENVVGYVTVPVGIGDESQESRSLLDGVPLMQSCQPQLDQS